MVERCERYFRSLDELVGEAVELAGPEATIVLASDHGFGPTRDVFHINSWLEQNGYLYWAEGEGRTGARADTDIGFAEMTRHVHALDWTRTLAYAATPSSQGIHVVPNTPGTSAPLPEDARARIACELVEALMSLRRPWDGQPAVESVWTREQAFAGPYEQFGPDVSIVLADGATMSILPSEAIFAQRPQIRGHHRWEGIFLAVGPGIREGAEVAELSIVDVAPFVLHRLGLPIPDTMTGRLPVEVFEPGELERRPPRRTHSIPAQSRVPVPAAVPMGPEDEAEVMQRLRALGYVE